MSVGFQAVGQTLALPARRYMLNSTASMPMRVHAWRPWRAVTLGSGRYSCYHFGASLIDKKIGGDLYVFRAPHNNNFPVQKSMT
jgi:hypothetical protein